MSRLASEAQQPQRLKMIERALRDQAPRTYRQLRAAGQLQEFLENRDQLLLESFNDAEVAGHQSLPKTNDPLEHLQNHSEATRRAWEEALATWLEFSDPSEEPTTESSLEI